MTTILNGAESSWGDENVLAQEVMIAKFRRFAKEKFQDSVKFKVNQFDFIKNISRHYAFNLPPEIGEFFISEKTSPLFWISDTPVVSNVEDYYKNLAGGLTYNSHYQEIKKFYSKWITYKSEKEKQYYALSAINLIERYKNEKNVLSDIMYAVILSNDQRIFSPDKAIQKLYEALEEINNLDLEEEWKNELRYLTNLYIGFAHLTNGQPELAHDKFSGAQEIKHGGISAVFYAGLAETRLKNKDEAINILAEIVEFDKLRLNYAIRANSLYLFAYFLQTAVTYNIFSTNSFADYLFDFEVLLTSSNKENKTFFIDLYDAVEKVEEAGVEKFITKDILNELQFFKQYVNKFRFNPNAFIPFTYDAVTEKFNGLSERISEKLRSHFDNLTVSSLMIYDEQLNKLKRERASFAEAIKRKKEDLKKHLDEAMAKIEREHNEIIKYFENKIEHLGDISKLNPSSTFNNMMVLNTVVSLIVFIIGGFADGFMNADNIDQSMLIAVVVGGVKWGAITFFLGIMVAIFSSISTIWDKSSQKQRVIREISIKKNLKERKIEALKKEYAFHLDDIEDQVKRKERHFKQEEEELVIDKQAL
ncbi:MAG: hypothetical protein GXO87_03030 [Chlorobi bacterium]|nr:hypothetical protein [Chlorobiota bacterium]